MMIHINKKLYIYLRYVFGCRSSFHDLQVLIGRTRACRLYHQCRHKRTTIHAPYMYDICYITYLLSGNVHAWLCPAENTVPPASGPRDLQLLTKTLTCQIAELPAGL